MDYKSAIEKIKSIFYEEENVESVVEETVEIPFASTTLDDASVIYYNTLEIGSPVFINEELTQPLTDGEYTLENETVISVVNGEIIEIAEVEDEVIVEVVEPAEVELNEDSVEVDVSIEDLVAENEALKIENEALKLEIDQLKGDHEVDASEFSTQKENFEKEIADLKEEIEKLKDEPAVEPIAQVPQETSELTIKEKRLNALSAIRKLKK